MKLVGMAVSWTNGAMRNRDSRAEHLPTTVDRYKGIRVGWAHGSRELAYAHGRRGGGYTDGKVAQRHGERSPLARGLRTRVREAP